eukprot:146228-Prorocentrum_minimum.AAC.2
MSKPGVLSMIRTIMNEFRGYVITLICATCRSEFRMATFARFRKARVRGYTSQKVSAKGCNGRGRSKLSSLGLNNRSSLSCGSWRCSERKSGNIKRPQPWLVMLGYAYIYGLFFQPLRATINEMKKIDEQMDRQVTLQLPEHFCHHTEYTVNQSLQGQAVQAMFDEMQKATQQVGF